MSIVRSRGSSRSELLASAGLPDGCPEASGDRSSPVWLASAVRQVGVPEHLPTLVVEIVDEGWGFGIDGMAPPRQLCLIPETSLSRTPHRKLHTSVDAVQPDSEYSASRNQQSSLARGRTSEARRSSRHVPRLTSTIAETSATERDKEYVLVWLSATSRSLPAVTAIEGVIVQVSEKKG